MARPRLELRLEAAEESRRGTRMSGRMFIASVKPLPVAAGYGVAFFTVAVLLSWAWKRVFRHGPLEWIMRTVAG